VARATVLIGYTHHMRALPFVLAGCFSLPGLAAEDITVTSEAVAGSEVPWSIVEATIPAPAAAVWAIVSNCAEYRASMPNIAQSRELSRTGDPSSSFTTMCEVTADLPFPFSDLTSVNRAVHTVEPGKRYVRAWTMVRGDYDYNEGSWTIVALDERTSRATYRLRVRPKMPVPDSMLGTFQAKTMPRIIERLRAHTAATRVAAPIP
jgi:ribosome-associated toxin RatA of RatAB toxin-antitoxin module